MIKSHQEFTEIIKNAKFKKNKNLVLYRRTSKYSYPHFGIAITKKMGNAVTRNLCKRRMRALFDKYENKLRTDSDYIIIMKENSSSLNFKELEESFLELL